MSDYGEHTRAAHPPAAPTPVQRPLGLPVYRSSVFSFDTAQEYADVVGNRMPGYVYSRIDNPTVDAFAAAVAALEGHAVDGEVTGQAFASGMAAISTVLLTFLETGAHVVASRELYGGTYSLLHRVLPRYGVTTTFVDIADLDAVRAAMRPQTGVVWAETMANPTLTVADLPSLAAIAHEAEAVLGIDSTFASPAVCRPLEHGVDVVVHSATKYIGGHSDATGGVAVGAPELMSRVRELRTDLGGSMAPDEAFLMHRGLATLPLRVARSNATSLAVASAVEGHPALDRVHHPGLPSHRDHALAIKLFDAGRFGGIVTVDVRGGREAGMAFCDRLRLAQNATSLAGAHTVVSHVASTTHRQLDDAALAAGGLAAGSVRIAIGLEDADDLIADITQALGPA
ncbi:MAG: aminotransferase class I/II-fold pyridoxal phosphate-dependent enzyme [Pseudonocardiales bacterium]